MSPNLTLFVNDVIRVMMKLPSCCLLTSTMTLLFISVISLAIPCTADGSGTTTQKPKTETDQPFLQSSMFIGLAAGVGGFLAFMVLCCIVWKCFCGGETDFQRHSFTREIARCERMLTDAIGAKKFFGGYEDEIS
ncbi:hypothetical protein MAR_018575 [Mya arenaria]|uniref:Transmembrane protein n=1 Tax=Mya arenaria TaxID=6604 RepID=A0ABY7EF21_MYAAR|nr:hypothetical protein MAR_018575 [Mya arenaria]